MTTSRAGGLHKPPWGIPHAEPIGSSNNPPLAVVAPPPQMWQLFLSLPCVKGGGTACRDGGIVLLCFATSTIPQSLRDSSLYTREPPLRRELCKAKAFWNHQHCWWFSFNKNVVRMKTIHTTPRVRSISISTKPNRRQSGRSTSPSPGW